MFRNVKTDIRAFVKAPTVLSGLSRIFLVALLCFTLGWSTAQATFSIVAVDTITGAIGSAGASCIANSQIIHGVVEGIGAINTQAFYIAANQVRADSLLRAGDTPDSIVGYMFENDAQNNPHIRQYGVVTLAGPGSSAGFTGLNTNNYKGHKTGPGYSIQGNILLGAQVLDTMEFAFLNTPGPLEEKLMAAIEAANIPGADTRCLSCNKPAISAFVRVIHLGDGATPYLYETVTNTTCGNNPVPALRVKYDLWKALRNANADSSTVSMLPLNLGAGSSDSAEIVITPRNYKGNSPVEGSSVFSVVNTGNGTLSSVTDNGNGTFTCRLYSPSAIGQDTVKVIVEAGGVQTLINQQPVMTYFLVGDADGSLMVDISDAVFLIAYIFQGGPPPFPDVLSGDGDCNGFVDISDAVALIAYIFSGGPAPCS